jgi:hypothetical protein
MLSLLWPGHSAEQAKAVRPTIGLAGRRTRPASARSARTARRAQSVCRGTVRCGSPAVKPRQGVHCKLPHPMVLSPNTVESPSSKRERWVKEGQNSPARSTVPELNGGEGVSPSGWGAALGSSEALGPAYGERGGVKWLSTNEVVENGGECGGDGLPEADTALVRMRRRGWPPFIVVHCVEATRAAP